MIRVISGSSRATLRPPGKDTLEIAVLKSSSGGKQNEDGLSFVIPTKRLREVSETVEQYEEDFWRHGHSPETIVFDDSTPANQEKYFPLLEKTETHYDLFYVRPREREQSLVYLNSRLRDRRLESLVRRLFRPS